jgi:RNA polymerase sigma-70 factor (ECF subfamily)
VEDVGWLRHIAAAQAGDDRALEELMEAFKPVLHRIARRYSGVSFDDALQEAWLSFLVCVKTFKADLGVPFVAYVHVKVRGDVRTVMRRWWKQSERSLLTGVQAERDEDERLERYLVHASGKWSQTERGYDHVEWQSVFEQAGLSERERWAMTSLLEGFTTTDLGVQARVSSETAKTWRRRAVRKLRRVWPV